MDIFDGRHDSILLYRLVLAGLILFPNEFNTSRLPNWVFSRQNVNYGQQFKINNLISTA